MPKTVDSFRFLDYATRTTIKAWINLEKLRSIPWTPLRKPLNQCTLALVSSGAIALKTDKPFDQEGERQNPWWGDPSYRILPRTATEADVNIYHLHIPTQFAEQDLNVLMPVQRLNELVQEGVIGDAAARHYSFMGYMLDPTELLKTSTPAMIRHLHEDEVDGVILIPA